MVRYSISSIKSAIELLDDICYQVDKINNSLTVSRNDLDKEIKGKVSGYERIISDLKTSQSNCSNIIDECYNYIDEYNKKIEEISNVSFAHESIIDEINKIDTNNSNEVLSLGKGPLNTNLLNNPEQHLQEIKNKQVEKKLSDLGLHDDEIKRIMNGESSIESVMDEINNNPDCKKEMYANEYLKNYSYDHEVISKEIEKDKNRKSEIEKRLIELHNPVDFSSDSLNEKKALEKELKEINRDIIDKTQLLENYGDIDINFDSIPELNKSITELDEKISSLLSKFKLIVFLVFTDI